MSYKTIRKIIHLKEKEKEEKIRRQNKKRKQQEKEDEDRNHGIDTYQGKRIILKDVQQVGLSDLSTNLLYLQELKSNTFQF